MWGRLTQLAGRSNSWIGFVLLAALALPTGGAEIPARATEPGVGAQPGPQVDLSQAPSPSQPRPAADLEAITFAGRKPVLYLSVRDVARATGWRLRYHRRSGAITLGDRKVARRHARRLLDGTRLVVLSALRNWGVELGWNNTHKMAWVRTAEGLVWIEPGKKRVVVNRAAQRLRAWQGKRMVAQFPVSTGRRGYETPRGTFSAGPLKTPLLISRKYDNARMPWSVQVDGDVCIHGHASVPPRPASHGCIRVPLAGPNPARWFYEWVDVGTPITIADRWPRQTSAARGSARTKGETNRKEPPPAVEPAADGAAPAAP